MNEQLILCNRLKEARASQHLSQAQLAKLVGVSRNTISSIETGQFNPTAKLALLLCIALTAVSISFVHAITARLKIEQIFKYYWTVVSGLALISLVLAWYGM